MGHRLCEQRALVSCDRLPVQAAVPASLLTSGALQPLSAVPSEMCNPDLLALIIPTSTIGATPVMIPGMSLIGTFQVVQSLLRDLPAAETHLPLLCLGLPGVTLDATGHVGIIPFLDASIRLRCVVRTPDMWRGISTE